MSNIFRRGRVTKSSEIESLLAQGLAIESPIYRKNLHGASVSRCSRRAVLHTLWSKEAREQSSPASEFYFGIGNAIHEAIHVGANNIGIEVANELRITYRDRITGYIDEILVDPVTDCLLIVDGKSCGKLPSSIKPDHEAQLATYALLTGIHSTAILYVSRSVAGFDGQMIWRLLKADLNLEFYARVMATSLIADRRRIVVPHPEHMSSRSACGFCPFKEFCWDDTPFPTEIQEHMITSLEPLSDEIDSLAAKILAAQPSMYRKTLKRIPMKISVPTGWGRTKQVANTAFQGWLERHPEAMEGGDVCEP